MLAEPFRIKWTWIPELVQKLLFLCHRWVGQKNVKHSNIINKGEGKKPSLQNLRFWNSGGKDHDVYPSLDVLCLNMIPRMYDRTKFSIQVNEPDKLDYWQHRHWQNIAPGISYEPIKATSHFYNGLNTDSKELSDSKDLIQLSFHSVTAQGRVSGWLSQPSAQVANSGTSDPVPHRAPCSVGCLLLPLLLTLRSLSLCLT